MPVFSGTGYEWRVFGAEWLAGRLCAQLPGLPVVQPEDRWAMGLEAGSAEWLSAPSSVWQIVRLYRRSVIEWVDWSVGCTNAAMLQRALGRITRFQYLSGTGLYARFYPLRTKWLQNGMMWLVQPVCGKRLRFLPLRHGNRRHDRRLPLCHCPLSLKAFFPTGGENVCSPEHSKLCFLQHASASAAKNACPCRGRNLAPKSQIVREGHNGGKAADGKVSHFNDSKYE